MNAAHSLLSPRTKPTIFEAPSLHWRCLAVALCAIYGHCAFAAPAPSAPSARPSINYTVKPADKLLSLTKSLLISPSAWPEVARFNQLKNPDLLMVGQVLAIPLDLLKPIALSGKIVSATGQVLVNQKAVANGDTFTENARIETAADGLAIVELADGSRVTVMPKSIAQVIRQRAYSTNEADLKASASSSTTWFSGAIRLVQGSIDTLANKATRRSQPLEVTTPTSIVGVRGTQFRVSYTPETSLSSRTEVLEGAVNAANPIANADVPKGFGAAILAQDRVIKVVPLLPAPPLGSAGVGTDITVQRTQEGLANLPLIAIAGAESYRVQIASDASFTALRYQQVIPSLAANIGPLPNGVWHIRVRGIDPNGIEGYDSNNILLLKDAPLVPATPLTPKSVAAPKPQWLTGIAIGASLKALPNESLLTVNTTPADFPSNLMVALARTNDFADAAMLKVQEGKALLPTLQAGERYYLRFSSGTSADDKMSSQVTYVMNVPSNWKYTVLDTVLGMQVSPR